ncbi:MAG: cell wall metabolism sensor histidine kinase WalK [Clostridiales bacterium]|nr:cell wall metabolism sensor histidine kinase WalK [Clostridiales bacterium]
MRRKILIIFCSILLVGVLLTGFLSLSLIKVNYENSLDDKIYTIIGLSIIIGLLASFVLAYRFINKMVGPLIEMTEATKQISDGDLTKRISVTSSDEIGKLATNFNNMAKRLSETIKELSESNINLSAVLRSIINPIIAVDNNHRIVLINPAAEQLFAVSAEEAKNMHILEVFRNNILDEELIHILENKIERQIEIFVNIPQEKILKIHTNLIKPKNQPDKIIGVVVLIQDVTEIRKLEKMRSGFVANVSHELRTPLTSISGFIETLKSGAIDDEKTKKRFLDIIDIETERLTRLIDDILTLSDIENTKHKDNRQKILPSESIKEIEEIMTPVAKAKGVRIISEIESNLTSVYGNKDWFKQMMINLLDNAIKYTISGGKVHILAYEKYNKIFILVKDSGIGIPKKDLPRLFERFYRVDKARSRKVGGTGLGLAIVKHIVLSFDGKIKVSSEKGKGTEFTVIIPINKLWQGE